MTGVQTCALPIYLENTIIQLRPANDPLAEWEKLNSTNMQIKDYYDEPLSSLFCMSAFKINPVKDISVFNIDERFFDFGFGLMILRQDLFMERLRKAVTELSLRCV